MKTRKKLIVFYLMLIYLAVYLVSITTNNVILANFIKPIAPLLTCYCLRSFVVVAENSRRTTKLIYIAFLVWVIVDIFLAISETYYDRTSISLETIYNIEIVLHAGVRILIFASAVALYHLMTLKANKFQIISDIITISSCILISGWIIFFRGRTDSLLDENTFLFLKADPKTLLSSFHLFMSTSILGVLLISWFQFQTKKMTLGLRFIMLGVAGIAGTDMLMALDNSLLYGNLYIDISYRVSILMVGAGGILFEKYPYRFSTITKITYHQSGTWKDAFYLLAYPLSVVLVVGFQVPVIIFLLVIAFYISSCLYVKQIALTDSLLISEKDYNKQLELYSSVIEQSPLSVVITDVDGNIQYVNPYFSKVSGYSRNEAIGNNPRIFKSSKTPKSTYEVLWNRLANGEKWGGELINVNKNGEEYEENVVILPIKDSKDVITNYVAIKENISDANKIRSQLNNQNYFTSQVLDTIPSAIFYISITNQFLGSNRAYKKLYGIDSCKVLGADFSNAFWIKDESNVIFDSLKAEAIKTDKPCVIQFVRKSATGGAEIFLYSVSTYYLTDGSIGGFLGVMTDISELKEKEEALEKALEQANAATTAKSQFLANMSHEIRTPMNAVIGLSYLALKTSLDEKQMDYIQKIHFAATSLLGIINDILDFSKIESDKLELESIEFDIDKEISNSIGLFVEKASEKNLEFLYHLPVDIPHKLKGDPLRLRQVITNLVSNSLKFTEKGEIAVVVSEEKRVGNRIKLKFSVEDTGIGIKEENIGKLFEVFTQSDNSTTRKFGGTGLGLAISKRLVEMMGGEIRVESRFGEGSNFSFTAWFLFESDNAQEEPIIPYINKLKVLVVDDNQAAREILQDYLKYIGFRVNAVSSGREALDILVDNDKDDPFHIAFIDWKMPEMDGIQTINNILTVEKLDNIPALILVTAYDKDELINQVKYIHVDSILTKPVSQSTLFDTVLNLFNQNSGKAVSYPYVEDDFVFSGVKVLLAEDNEINQQIALELLSGQGIAVNIASNGLEAVEMMEKNDGSANYDLILMDLQMPVMDGFEAARKIRKASPKIPIIAMTARTMFEEKEKCYAAGMNDHVSKPIDPATLLATIKNWVEPNRVILSSRKPLDPAKLENTISIAGIDTDSGISRVANNTQLYIKLLGSFAANQCTTAAAIKQAFSEADFSAVEQLSHTLRGVSGNIGATNIHLLCEKIEKGAKTISASEMSLLIDQLQDEMDKVSALIIDYLKQAGTEEPYQADTDLDIAGKMDTLLFLLNEGDSQAVEYFKTIKGSLKRLIDADYLSEIEKHITGYDFEKAIVLIREELGAKEGVNNE